MLPSSITHLVAGTRLGKAVRTVRDAGLPMSREADVDLTQARILRLEALQQRQRAGHRVLRSEAMPDEYLTDDQAECILIEAIAVGLVIGCYMLGDGSRQLFEQSTVSRPDCERVGSVFDLSTDDVVCIIADFYQRIGRRSLNAAVAARNPDALAMHGTIRAAWEQWLGLVDGIWYGVRETVPFHPTSKA